MTTADDPGPGTYQVTFVYVEPEYARQRGIAELPYTASFTVRARSASHAVAVARDAFDAAARLSSVAWPRNITESSWRWIG
jgi:1,2-phenylacetyl-CoA epoxidase PaaB subunit